MSSDGLPHRKCQARCSQGHTMNPLTAAKYSASELTMACLSRWRSNFEKPLLGGLTKRN